MLSVRLWICSYQISNAWTNLYETWHVHHGTGAHLKSAFHKSLPSICVCMCIPTIVARQRLGKHVTAEKNTHAIIEELLDASFSLRSVSYQRQVGDQFFSELLIHMTSPHACYMSVSYNLPRCNFLHPPVTRSQKMAFLHVGVGHRLTITHHKSISRNSQVHSLHIEWNRDFKVSLKGCNV
jgi:hypothetical protein